MTGRRHNALSDQWSDHWHKAQTRFHLLPRRDRLALMILTGFVAVMIVIYGMILPAVTFHASARQSFQEEQALLHWLQEQQPAIQALAGADTGANKFSGSPLTLVNTSAKEFQLNIKRLQPENNGNLRVWMEDVSFEHTLRWLHHLQIQGLAVKEITLDHQPDNRVNVRAVF